MVSVHPWHHDIQDDQVKWLLQGHFNRFCPVLCLVYPISFPAEKDVQDLTYLGIVIHNKYLRTAHTFFRCQLHLVLLRF